MNTLTRLRPKSKIPTDFYVFDTETGRIRDNKIEYQLRGRPDAFLFGVVYGHNFTKIIYSVEDFQKEFKDSRYKNKKVFCHNAEYDLNVLYSNIYKLDPEAIFNGKFIRATNGNCIFADSMNIFPYSVKKIGEKIGLKKTMYYTDREAKDNKIPASDINDCIRDCEIIFDALLGFFEQVGDIKITQASLSLTYFRRFFLQYNIDHNENTKFFWNSYYGGRCEAFKLGATNSYVYDFNSMYPDAMRNAKFPHTKYLKTATPSVKQLFNYLKNFEGVAHVKIRHNDNWIGYLPYKFENKLLFPVGTFSGWYNFNELRYALDKEMIQILAVDLICFARPMQSPFIKFIEENYKLRFMLNNDMEIERIKVFMNSLYGKFAQRITEETIYIENMIKQAEIIENFQKNNLLIEIIPFNEDRDDCFIKVKKTSKYDLSFAIPSFASYITSHARIKILDTLEKYKDFTPVYCDTDSIFTEKEIDLPPVEGKPLGALKKENKTVTHIAGLKNYSYLSSTGEEINKIKGVPKKAKKLADNLYTYDSLVKTREGLRRQLLPGTTKTTVKRLSCKYTKRIVLENLQTIPIKF